MNANTNTKMDPDENPYGNLSGESWPFSVSQSQGQGQGQIHTNGTTRAPAFYFVFLFDNRTNSKTAVVMFFVFAVLLCTFSILVAHHHNSGYYITGVVFSSIALLVPVLRLVMHNAFPSLAQILFWRTFYFTWELFVAASALLLFMRNSGAIAGTCILFVFAGLFTLYNISKYFTSEELRLVAAQAWNFRE